MKSLRHLPSSSLISLAVAAVALLLFPASAVASCSAPSSSGVAICQPSVNSTVFQVPHIEAAATPTSGSIRNISVFIDGRLELQNVGPAMDLYPGGLSNGTHHLVIKATDGAGRAYQASEYFGVTGNLPQSCPVSVTGVRICSPASGEAVSQLLGMAIGFKGAAPITRLRAYAGSTLLLDYRPERSEHQFIGGGSGTTAGKHTLNVVANDSAGHIYKSSVSFKAFYDGSCEPRTGVCTPGIYMNGPFDGDDVAQKFRISASVENNTAPITTMRAYLNGHVVAQSFGPTLDQQITTAKGTRILVIQAWDTAGRLYRISQNVNVQ